MKRFWKKFIAVVLTINLLMIPVYGIDEETREPTPEVPEGEVISDEGEALPQVSPEEDSSDPTEDEGEGEYDILPIDNEPTIKFLPSPESNGSNGYANVNSVTASGRFQYLLGQGVGKFWMGSPYWSDTNAPAMIYNLKDSNTGNWFQVYCSDYYTIAYNNHKYARENLETTAYYGEAVRTKIRAIVENSYPFLTYEQMQEDLAAYLEQTGQSFACDVDLGQIISATQFSIWNAANNLDMRYGKTDLGADSGYDHFTNDRSTYQFTSDNYTSSEHVAENIDIIMDYLDGCVPSTDAAGRTVIDKVTAEIVKGTDDSYVVTVYLSAPARSNDNLTVTLSGAVDITHPVESGKDSVVFTLDGDYSDSTFTATLSGTQHLDRAAYLYYAEDKTGASSQTGNQAMIGVGEGSAPVSDKATVTINSTEATWVNVGLIKTAEVDGVKTSVPVVGATFDLYHRDSLGADDTLIASGATDSNGKIAIQIAISSNDAFDPDDYYFVETSAPENFVYDEYKQWPIGSEVNNEYVAEAVNKSVSAAETSLTVYKVEKDGDHRVLKGAEFSLYVNNEFVKSYTTDAQGKIEIKGLVPGEYKLVETKAPEYYITPYGEDSEVTFTVEYNQETKKNEVVADSIKGTNVIENEGTVSTIGNDRADASAQVTAKKQVLNVNGDVLDTPGRSFQFTLYTLTNGIKPEDYAEETPFDEGRIVFGTTSSDSATGGITFNLGYKGEDISGEHWYVIRETDTSSGYTFDRGEFYVKVSFTKSGDSYDSDVTYYKFEEEQLQQVDEVVFTNQVRITTRNDYTSLTVVKVWDDEGYEGIRPTSVDVQLYRDGDVYGNTVTLSEENGWSYKWTRLDDDYTWTVEEVDVPDEYISTIDEDGLTVTITNTYDEPDMDIPDDDIPLADLPEEDVPLTDLPEEDVPLADVPLVELPDEDVPLDDVPSTGDTGSIWDIVFVVSAIGLLAIMIIDRRKRRNVA